jgi:SAM-dependent methyltransferase
MSSPNSPPQDASFDGYERTPYTSHAYAESHPDRLRVVARLSGWNPPTVPGARILEVGCGRGGNLLAMAISLPGAELVGVERSAHQAAEARTIAGQLGVTNVTVHTASFTDPDVLRDAEGTFDFVVAHGIASWIPPEDRTTLLGRMARWLSPNGVGYVSFNVLPGWYERFAARDWLRFCASEDGRATGHAAAPVALHWLHEAISPELTAYRRGLASVEARLRETDVRYLVHEYMEGENHPVRVTDFFDEAERAGLTYLGDAIPASVALETLPDPVRRNAEALSVRGAQALVDFVRCTAFRRALFVRKDKSAARGWRFPWKLDVEVVRSLRIASRLRPSPNDPACFEGTGTSVQVPSTLAQAALLELYEAAPRALTFDVLLERAKPRSGGSSALEGGEELAGEVRDLWLAVDGIDLHDYDPPFEVKVTERPKGCPFARLQAKTREGLTNRWHQEVILRESILGDVLLASDGTRTTSDIARVLSIDEELVKASLLVLAKSALLIG